MNPEDRAIVRRRLDAQRLSSPPAATPAEAVRWMTAMQGQDFAGVKWSIGCRTAGATEATIDAALLEGSIVRSWPMRGTLHVVAAEDLHWMLSLTTDRLVQGAKARRAALGLEPHQLDAARAAAIDALQGGRRLTREQMHAVFAGAGISPEGQRGYHVLWFLSQTGTLCFGPPEGKQQTFVLLDEWVPNPRRLDREEALAEWVLRYFRSHGPASIRDFAWWSSLTLRDSRIGLALVREQLSSLDRDGEDLYFVDEGARSETVATAPDGIRLLAGFDEYLLGYQNRSPQLSPSHAAVIVPGGNGMFRSTIVSDGEVVGTWSRTRAARGMHLEAQPFTDSHPELDGEFLRAGREYAHFHGLRLAETVV